MTARRSIRLGTRGSALATTQSGLVARALEAEAQRQGLDLEVVLTTIRTQGDVDPTSLARLGGAGVFAAALREALLEGRCELAVHSFKDLPTAGMPGLQVLAVPPREDPWDALCSRPGLEAGPGGTGAGLADLPPGARVGTGSPRRAAQLLARRPDLMVVDMRGNVPTRLSRVVGQVVSADGAMGAVRDPDLDAVVLAWAGLKRLGLDAYVSQVLGPRLKDRSDTAPGGAQPDFPLMLPAASQGALAVEAREDLTEQDPELAALLRQLDDPVTRAAVQAERAVMRRLEAGCAAPVAALAMPDRPGRLRLEALVASLDGREVLRQSAQAPLGQAEGLGAEVAEALLAAGAEDLVDLHATHQGRRQ